jgi:hypothetical protein
MSMVAPTQSDLLGRRKSKERLAAACVDGTDCDLNSFETLTSVPARLTAKFPLVINLIKWKRAG